MSNQTQPPFPPSVLGLYLSGSTLFRSLRCMPATVIVLAHSVVITRNTRVSLVVSTRTTFSNRSSVL